MNTGVIISALLVAQLNMAWPDLVIATVIALVVLRSAIRIIRDAQPLRRERKQIYRGVVVKTATPDCALTGLVVWLFNIFELKRPFCFTSHNDTAR